MIRSLTYLTDPTPDFSTLYLEVRKKEGRVYSDKQVSLLPKFTGEKNAEKEWRMRERSLNRIIKYLSNLRRPLTVLDLGCGNGWFTNQLAHIPNTDVIGVDINEQELFQASRIFEKKNLKFVYANIFDEKSMSLNEFDIITVNSCIQYFPNLKVIIETLLFKLKEKGELHIIDSPFYAPSEIAFAKIRSLKYYQELGFPEMAEYYYHHTLDDINEYKVLYERSNSFLSRLWNNSDSPFPWLVFSG